jgi:AcrR family transcriptional regulator
MSIDTCEAQLFMQQGIVATSVREIGERASVGQSSLYHHVQSKGLTAVAPFISESQIFSWCIAFANLVINGRLAPARAGAATAR